RSNPNAVVRTPALVLRNARLETEVMRPRALYREPGSLSGALEKQHVLVGQVVEMADQLEPRRLDLGRETVAILADVAFQPLLRHRRVRAAAVEVDHGEAAPRSEALADVREGL